MNNVENQVGCGYCVREKDCDKYDPKINKAKLGCDEFLHHAKAFIQNTGRGKTLNQERNERS